MKGTKKVEKKNMRVSSLTISYFRLSTFYSARPSTRIVMIAVVKKRPREYLIMKLNWKSVPVLGISISTKWWIASASMNLLKSMIIMIEQYIMRVADEWAYVSTRWFFCLNSKKMAAVKFAKRTINKTQESILFGILLVEETVMNSQLI